jgi:hypothetical protein
MFIYQTTRMDLAMQISSAPQIILADLRALALPIAVTSYKIESLLTAVVSRKQVPPGLESN